jgi:hypothetical protein
MQKCRTMSTCCESLHAEVQNNVNMLQFLLSAKFVICVLFRRSYRILLGDC